MKIIKKDEEIAKREAVAKETVDQFKKDQEEYFESLRQNEAFQKFFVQGLIEPELQKTTNLEWMYKPSNEEVISNASNSKLGEMVRRNRIIYRVLKNIVTPVVKKLD